MKKLLIFIIIFSALRGQSQTQDTTRAHRISGYMWEYSRLKHDSGLIIPIVGDTSAKAAGQIKILNNQFLFTGQDRHWHTPGSGGGGPFYDSILMATQYRMDSMRLNLYLALAGKQASLISGTNLKTVGGFSLLGTGDIPLSAAAAWGAISGNINTQNDLINLFNLKVKYSDTAGMLSPYLRSSLAATTYQPIGSYATSAQLALKVNISDTGNMLSPYLKSNVAIATYQPTGSYATTSQLAAKVNVSDTGNMLSPYLRSNIASATYQATGSYATSSALTAGLALKVNITDTAVMLAPYAIKDSIYITESNDSIYLCNKDGATLIVSCKFQILDALGSGVTPLSVVTKTTTYNMTTSDDVVLGDASSGAFNIKLPSPASATKQFTIKRVNSGSNNITVVPNASETIDGGASAVMTVQYMSLTFFTNGINWFIK